MEAVLGSTLTVFIGMTVILFGGVAIMTGRALAVTWRPYWHAFGYIVLLGGANRFLAFALFDSVLLSVSGYIATTVVLLAICLAAYRITQASCMVRQYPWIYRRAGLFSWRNL